MGAARRRGSYEARKSQSKGLCGNHTDRTGRAHLTRATVTDVHAGRVSCALSGAVKAMLSRKADA